MNNRDACLALILAALLPQTSLAATYSSEVLSDNPIGYWRLGEAIPATAADASPQNLDGTYTNGVTLGVAGAIANDSDTAALFDGIDDYVEVPANSAFNQLQNDFTIEAWIKFDSSPSGRIVSTRNHGSNGGYGFSANGNILGFTFFSVKDYLVNVSLPANDWTYVAVSIDSSNDATFYVDGAQVGTVSGNSPAFTNTQPLNIGRNPILDGNNSYQPFDGSIDEVAIYGTALDAAAIERHYLAAPEPTSSLLAAVGAIGLLMFRTRRCRP